uniref:AIRS_C domain-containing protein n=1 Tax=Steinernema glaseri TaxID=37863 RepID=A0A1I8AAB3_9BILA
MLLVKIGPVDIEMYSGALSGYLSCISRRDPISPPFLIGFCAPEPSTHRAVIRMTVGEKRTAQLSGGGATRFRVTIAVMSGYLAWPADCLARSPHAPRPPFLLVVVESYLMCTCSSFALRHILMPIVHCNLAAPRLSAYMHSRVARCTCMQNWLASRRFSTRRSVSCELRRRAPFASTSSKRFLVPSNANT